MPKISFFLRSNGANIKNKTIYCRVTFNATKTEFSLGEKIDPDHWNQKLHIVVKNPELKKFIQLKTESISYKLKSIALVNERLNAVELVQHCFETKKEPFLVELIEKYIESFASKLSAATIKNHKIKLNNLLLFQVHTKKRFTISSFGLSDAQKFIQWFSITKSTDNVTSANRNVSFYSLVLKHYRKKGEIPAVELISFVGTKDKINSPLFLTESELMKIEKKQFNSLLITKVKDLFLFQCYTGLSYADIWNGWKIEVRKGFKIIVGTRAKNGQNYFVPVNEKVEEILNRYNTQLPELSNQVYNRVLKELVAFCNIDKQITTHTARKTFCTQMDSEGWTRESVSKMLGHGSIRTTELYYLGDSSARIETELENRKRSA